uniref:NADH-ubiquinone oxidoreductase chain 5 n=1 Tax=Homotoma ficus TaxID=2218120 RepID=A0A344A2F1_9HEMI|nr:NADH dehydrogenase subunit 5 [Homotoma ficus]AWU48942.1 NADH dehydrogenase subunit 5 [Homotoma ficus]
MKFYSKFYFIVLFMLLKLIFLMSVLIMLFLNNQSILWELELLMCNSVNFSFVVYIDWMSIIFSFFVLFISLIILIYAKIYMGDFCSRFLWLTFLFICFMLIMIFSPSILGVILGWDGLGISSFCLVIYYQSFDSYNSGFITAASNRLGDSLLILSICWNSLMGYFMYWDSELSVLFFMGACLTKSAQFPFSAWLPAAMAAPTPISSLVHSSTLVTAGIYMMIRFSLILFKSGLMSLILLISMITIMLAGISSFQEYDVKRVVALSTLGQLGFMMMILSLGFSHISFFHLLIHAMFKALLFMCAGLIIHSGQWQDLRQMGNLNISLMVKISILISSFSLMGLPFSSGFYSKDMLVELAYCSYGGVGMGMFLYLGILITVSYSTRMLGFLLGTNYWVFWCGGVEKMKLSIVILSFFNIFIGSLINWLIIQDLSVIYLTMSMKLIPSLMIVFGMLLNNLMSNILLIYFNSMMYLMNLTKNLALIFIFMFKSMESTDQGWLEMILGLTKKTLLISSFWLKNLSMNFSMFTCMGIFMMMILMV